MRAIQLNSMNSRSLLYNMLELPPSKLIYLQLQQPFWKVEIFFISYKILLNCEPLDKFTENLRLLLNSVTASVV